MMPTRKLPPMSREEFLLRPTRTPAEVRAFTGFTEEAVYTLLRDGTFPSVRVGKFWKVSTRGVVRVLDGEDVRGIGGAA
jgi:hypothetical protein